MGNDRVDGAARRSGSIGGGFGGGFGGADRSRQAGVHRAWSIAVC